MRVCLTARGPTLAACLQCVTGHQRAIRCADEYMASIVLSFRMSQTSRDAAGLEALVAAKLIRPGRVLQQARLMPRT
jgi:hypothetical protein